MHCISSSVLKISQQPSSLQGTEQFVTALEFRSLMHPNTVLYDSTSSFSSNCASCCVNNLRCSIKNVNPSDPICISGFFVLLQIVYGSGGGMTSADMLLLEATIPAATAAATTTLTVTVVVVVAGSIPYGPTGATAAAPPALTPAAHDDAAF